MSDPFSITAETEPTEIILGSYSAWKTAYTYDGALYRMEYVLTSGSNSQTIVGAFTTGVWTFTVLGSLTQNWVSGDYAWSLNLVRLLDNEKVICRDGMMKLLRPTDDRRSKAAIMLGKIESILMNRADDDVESYTIGSRSITKMSLDELTRWRDYYKSEVSREKSGGRTPTLTVRFVP